MRNLGSQSKIYKGKLVSIEYEIEDIQQRLEMSSSIIFMVAIISLLRFLFDTLQYGYDSANSTVSLLLIILYLFLWRFSFRFALPCFVAAFIIYLGNFYLNLDDILQEPFSAIIYRAVVPVILLIGIGNVFYGWFKLSQIRQRELDNPDCVIYLNYVVKGEHIYDDQRQYEYIVTKIDKVEGEGFIQLLTLNNREEYVHYSILHHVYNKHVQIFIEKPLLSEDELLDALFKTELNRDINVYLSMIENLYEDENSWIDKICNRIDIEFENDKEKFHVLKSILERTLNGTFEDEIGIRLSRLLKKLKNNAV